MQLVSTTCRVTRRGWLKVLIVDNQNRSLQAVLADHRDSVCIAGCRALGLIDKVVTAPLWRKLSTSYCWVMVDRKLLLVRFRAERERSQCAVLTAIVDAVWIDLSSTRNAVLKGDNSRRTSNDEESDGMTSNIEGKMSFRVASLPQLVSMNVVSSFTKHNLHPDKIAMVLSILFGKHHFRVCLHHCEKDILLISSEVSLTQKVTCRKVKWRCYGQCLITSASLPNCLLVLTTTQVKIRTKWHVSTLCYILGQKH